MLLHPRLKYPRLIRRSRQLHHNLSMSREPNDVIVHKSTLLCFFTIYCGETVSARLSPWRTPRDLPAKRPDCAEIFRNYPRVDTPVSGVRLPTRARWCIYIFFEKK